MERFLTVYRSIFLSIGPGSAGTVVARSGLTWLDLAGPGLACLGLAWLGLAWLGVGLAWRRILAPSRGGSEEG